MAGFPSVAVWGVSSEGLDVESIAPKTPCFLGSVVEVIGEGRFRAFWLSPPVLLRKRGFGKKQAALPCDKRNFEKA